MANANNSPNLLHIFPTFAVGGSQIRFGQLVGLHGNRFHHNVIALDGVNTMAERIDRSAPVSLIGGAPSSYISSIKAAKLIADIRPDVLITYNWGSLNWWLAGRFFPNLPHVHIEDGFGPDERDQQLLRRILARRFILADRKTSVVVPSRTLEEIALRLWRLSPERLHYIPNGIDWHRFASHRRNSGNSRVVIGTVATLRPEKNLRRLIDLFCQAAAGSAPLNLELLIVGDGPDAESLKSEALRTPFAERIRFTGATREPEQFLAMMDIFALTSQTEQMPLSIIEAMACGLPIVSFGVGDVPTMVSHTNAPMAAIPLPDSEGFVQHLLSLARNPQVRLEIGKDNCLKARWEFDQQRMAKSYAALFDCRRSTMALKSLS